MLKTYFLVLSLLFSLNVSAQKTRDWLKLRPFRTAVLSDSLRENSGLTFWKERLFTINDSGNTADVFEIDKADGSIISVWPTGLRNIDWEAIAADRTYLYIGDIGNNAGTRKDLSIHQVRIADTGVVVESEIPFYYPEQKDFTSKNLDTNFDAEAMIFLNGKLHIFTKEWRSKATTHYVIDPTISEAQPARSVEKYPVGFTVTDASYYDGKLYLIGYTKNTEVYLSIFKEKAQEIFFGDAPRKIYLGSALTIGQIEGITADDRGLYLSGEALAIPVSGGKPFLYFVPFSALGETTSQ